MISAWAYATTGKYSDTIVGKLTVGQMLTRIWEDWGLGESVQPSSRKKEELKEFFVETDDPNTAAVVALAYATEKPVLGTVDDDGVLHIEVLNENSDSIDEQGGHSSDSQTVEELRDMRSRESVQGLSEEPQSRASGNAS